MIHKEFCRIVKQTKLLWEKIWSENKTYGADCKPYLVIYNPKHSYNKKSGENNIPVSEIKSIIEDECDILEMKLKDIKILKAENKDTIKKYKWLCLFSERIPQFNIEVRFKELNMDLIKRLRNNPHISHIENQRDCSDAGIRVILYKHEKRR